MPPFACQTLSRTICEDRDGALVLSHYPAHGSQDRHVHDHAQISFLLCGEIEETIGRRRYEAVGASVCIKPAGADHSDSWGRQGALMLSLRLVALEEDGLPVAVARWARADLAGVSMILRAALADGARPPVCLLTADLLACAGAAEPLARAPPAWLERVREAAADCHTFSAAAAADGAGVHRVHLSRAFARHFGMPLSVYRHRMRVARAVGAALRRPDALAEIAYGAGFSDQSHMTRALRDTAGVPPARLRRLFSPAAA